MHKCPECGLAFESHSKKANHIKWYHRDTTIALDKIRTERQKRKGTLLTVSKHCLKCTKEFTVQLYSNCKDRTSSYCSRACANSRDRKNLPEETRRTISEKIKTKWREGIYDSVQEVKLSKNKLFSSKKEREILKYFKEHFPEDEWTSGGSLKVESSRISRDMYSDKLKICFEYDGIWHFKDVHGQLAHKQKVDRLLEDWCIRSGYKLVRLDESAFTGIQQVIKAVYEDPGPVVKIGQNY